MSFWVLLIIGLFVLLVIQIFEVYLTLKLVHDLNDEIINIENDLGERVKIAERRLITLESERREKNNGRIFMADIENGENGQSPVGSGETTV